MRASEKSHFRLPRMHLLMAASSLALVVVTILLLRADHQRPWKQHQRTFHERVEPWLARSRRAHLESQTELAADGQAGPAPSPGALPNGEIGARPGSWTRRLLEWPFLEALARPLRIEQIVLTELPVDYHFCQAPRLDRCATCHQAIARSAWDDPTQPAVPVETQLAVELLARAPSERPSAQRAADTAAGGPQQATFQDAYGLRLAEEGILDPGAPTIELVVPRSPAALAGLAAGDVIVQLGGVVAAGRQHVEQLLLEAAARQQAVRLLVRRGLPHPFSSHPRLDLYVSSSSPHPAERFGCTICHGGQGAATEFVGAAHTPNDPEQQARWRRLYGWVREHDWPEPMLAPRFSESRCLQCHHQPLELEVLDAPVLPSPAVRERVASGRAASREPASRVREALHPISLGDSPHAQAGRPHPQPLSQRERGASVVAGYRLVRAYGCFGCHEIRGHDTAGRSVGPDMRPEPDMRAEPDDAPSARKASAASGSQPGDLRKVGPSLRGLAARVDAAYVADRLRDPRGFLPTTRMPRQYGLHEHLDTQSRALAQRREAVEIQAVAEYLLTAGGPVEGGESPQPPGDLPELAGASAEQGKALFHLRGCLACHQHRDFPDGGGTLGPDLAHMAAKYTTPEARQWLVRWIRDPAGSRPRSVMPRVSLDPLPNQEQPFGAAAPEGEQQPADPAAGAAAPEGAQQAADPAAHIAAYLLASARDAGWRPAEPAPPAESDLDELVAHYLARRFGPEQAERFARAGIPRELAGEVTADEAVLLAPAGVREKLLYAGRRSIARRGCFGCHDIPGFEAARPIGPELSDWGRKRVEELAFEQVAQWLKRAEPGGEAPDAFYAEAVAEKRREGFAWQKLRAPRSFDYQVAARKDYLDWLTMGQFDFTPAEREQIVAFLLSLVADPPPEPYVFGGEPRDQALVAGRELIERFACAECHTLRMERWTLELMPGAIGPGPELPEYDFLAPRIPAERLAAALKTDARGLRRAVLVGMARVDDQGRAVEDEDAEGNPLYYFTLWQPAAIDGHVWPVGGADVMVSSTQIRSREPPFGGRLARWLYPVVLARMRTAGLAGAQSAAWGSLPPPLAHEGAKVRAEWLDEYLLRPRAIRPAAVMRMPQYNLSADEVRRLTEYFAALAAADRPDGPRFAAAEGPAARMAAPPPGDAGEQYEFRLARMEQAMRLLIDRTTYCAKCHVIGDYRPGGEVQTIVAPDLTEAGSRLRPEYLYPWLAHPQAVLPYTAMPVNFPPEGGPLDPSVFPGTSREQLDAVVDLLLNYKWYLQQQTSIRRLMGQGP